MLELGVTLGTAPYSTDKEAAAHTESSHLAGKGQGQNFEAQYPHLQFRAQPSSHHADSLEEEQLWRLVLHTPGVPGFDFKVCLLLGAPLSGHTYRLQEKNFSVAFKCKTSLFLKPLAPPVTDI